MKTLAKGKNKEAIMRLLRVLIQTSQGIHGDVTLDESSLTDVADVLVYNEDGNHHRAELSAGNYNKSTMNAAYVMEDEEFYSRHN